MISSKPVLTDADRELYPVHLLEGCETGLCLFAAAFLGRNDAAHFEEAHVRTTCVDTDAERLGQMSFYYPGDWKFLPGDAWEFAESARDIYAQWDAVSVDPFSGDAMTKALGALNLWTSLAIKFVTVGLPGAPWADPSLWLHVGDDWRASVLPRSRAASWLVLERAC